MAERKHSPAGGQKPFAEFLREAPRSHGSILTVTGRVTQSSLEGHFMLDLGHGQTVELPIEAVRGYKVVEEGESLVEIELHLPELAGKSLADQQYLSLPTSDQTGGHRDLVKTPSHDNPYYNSYRAFPGPDPAGQFGYAAVPFTLASGHQAPQNAIAMQALTGQVAKPVLDLRTLPTYDYATVKEPTHDTVKELIKEHIKDPIYETVKEVYETLVEGGGTIQEGGGGGTLAEGGGIPGGGINQGGI